MTIKKWIAAMDDSEPDDHYPSVPLPECEPINCRCVIAFVESSWLEMLDESLDEYIGDTTPWILEFQDNPLFQSLIDQGYE